jgi:hypothetical protein
MTDATDRRCTTYHARIDEDGIVLGLARIRRPPGALYAEFYKPGLGWVEDHRAMDAIRNAQDYDFIAEDEAEWLVAEMEAGRA